MAKEAIRLDRSLKHDRLLTMTLLVVTLSLISAGATTTKTATITVAVTVQPSCTAGTTVQGNVSFGTLNFGTYSSLSRIITATGTQNAGAIQVQCTVGTNYKIVMGTGSNSSTVNPRYLASGANKISYNLYSDNAFQNIWDNVTGVSRVATGQQEWVPVYALVPSQSTPAAGTYSDSVQVTVSW
ncbi:MAG: Csu type fimbrial protein [Enterobacteriaceae bacterium]